MAIEKIITIDVDQVKAIGGLDALKNSLGQTEDKSKSLKAELAELKRQLSTLDEGTEQYQKIAQRAGEVADQIGDINTKIKNLGSDTKNIDAVVEGAQALSGAFSIASSTTALFGVENEDLQKQMLKVEAAIGLTVGIQSVANALQKESALAIGLTSVATKIQTGLQLAYTAVVGGTTGALKALRIALVSSGVGAFVVALGLLIEKMMSSSSATQELTEKQKALNRELEYSKELTDQQIKSLDFYTQIALASAKKRGASERELTKIQIDGINEKIKANTDEINSIKKTQDEEFGLTQEQNKRIQELRLQNQDLIRQGRLTIANFEAEQAQKQRDEEIKNAEDKKKRNEERAKKELEERKAELERLYNLEQQWLKKQNDLELASLDEIDKARKLNQDFQKSAQQVEIDNVTESYNVLIENAKKFGQDTTDLEIARLNAVNDINLKYQADFTEQYNKAMEESIAYELNAKQAFEDAKFNIANQGLQLLSQLAGKSKALAVGVLLLEKGLAISQVVINASRSIAQAQANLAATPAAIGVVPNPMYAVQAAATAKGIITTKISAGLAIASILAETIGKLSGGSIGGGGTGGGSIGGGSISAPTFNVVGQNPNNQLAQSIAQRQSQPIEAYVVSGNISNAQSLDRNRVNTATFG